MSVIDALNLPGIVAGQEIPTPVWAELLDETQAGLLILDAKLRILHATSQASSLLGMQSGENWEGVDVGQFLAHSALDPMSVKAADRFLHQTASSEADQHLLLNDLSLSRQLRMNLRSVGNEFRVASFDTGEIGKKADGLNVEFALRDALTGLASRPYFEQAVKTALADLPNQSIAVLLIDLDRFKAVNDTLGHAAGDALLRLAAQRLKAAIRKEDLVARLGGDEFAVLIKPSASAEEPIAIAERILDLVQRTYLIEGQPVNVGVSIGIARSPEDSSDFSNLLRNADLALYHSKNSGRATFHFFQPYMAKKAQARRTSELELRRALALRQLEVFYQPQVDTSLGRLVGFEALVRWRHPERGIIAPGEFLPIAEEIGLIIPLGDWVLRAACREAMRWPSDVVVAVNASPLQFETGTFADTVRQALKNTGLPGERLEIEITEGIMLKNDEAILRTLHELRSMSVRIAMDDFGTGYASLSQLARFPFDKIKIDRSLAGFEGDNIKQRAIVRAITALGHSLGVCTLAEGVEDAQQLARLEKDGCSSVQGYYFGRPVPASQLAEIISRLHSGVAQI